MIFKKVAADRAKSKQKHVRDLTDYIRAPEKTGSSEKVAYAGARGFLSDTHTAQQAEMAALALDAPRSDNPVNHYILSWREGEYPTGQQVEQAVDVLLQELGLVEHQAIYALHQDTDNLHLHIAVNRVHPDTLKAIKPNKGFDKEAGHRALARIEALQGWASEQNARYQVEEGKAVRKSDEAKPRKPSQKRLDMETRTGEQSAERICISVAAPLINAAQSWEGLHASLAEHGLRYERKGSGAILWVGDVAVKASSADRKATLSVLQKRLGAFVPANIDGNSVGLTDVLSVDDKAAAYNGVPLKAGAPRWQDYIADRKGYYQAKQREQEDLREQHRLERKTLWDSQRQERESVQAGSWQGRGLELNAMRQAMASIHAFERVKVKHRQALERERLRKRYQSFPSYEEWLKAHVSLDAAEQWRYREQPAEAVPARFVGDPAFSPLPVPQVIDGFSAQEQGNRVLYWREDSSRPLFADRGGSIDVHDTQDEEVILVALTLSAQRWERFQVTGSEAYKACCVRLAARHGFKLSNPELEEAIEAERSRLVEADTTTPSDEPVRDEPLQESPVRRRPRMR